MNLTQRATEWNTMATCDCPWCAEPAMVESAETDEVVCDACGVRATLAADPLVERVPRAA